MIRTLLTAALLALLGACGSNAPISSADPTFDFTAIRTYDFVPHAGTDGNEYQSLETSYLRNAMTRELERRGLTHSDSNPDVMVNFAIQTQEKVRSYSVPRTGYVGAYDYYDDIYYDGWGVTHQTRIDQYTEGTLKIDLIDHQARKLVWQGSASGRLTREMLANAQETLDLTVVEIMEQFPLPAPEAATP
ncbi:MAG: DUF4136 domain-containing protein [Pseudomonadota bacterium]